MRKEEVDALVETMTLSRKAILAKMKGNNIAKKKKNKNVDSGDDYHSAYVNDDEYSTVNIKDEDDNIDMYREALSGTAE